MKLPVKISAFEFENDRTHEVFRKIKVTAEAVANFEDEDSSIRNFIASVHVDRHSGADGRVIRCSHLLELEPMSAVCGLCC